jgi:catechol 2,3-dioxygenase-like lactoylglutathione lyase family enzyme
MPARLDHLVVLASSLDEGVAWCEATLGVTPGPGGQHPLMGTHNRLFSVGSPDFPLAYFEIIAIDPATPAPARRRWFDMDDPALQARVRRGGPQPVHWVARVDDAPAAVAALRAQGIDRGEVVTASRATPQGLLQWQITVRADGQRLFDGLLPTLIQWGAVHPAAAMPASGVTLVSLDLQHPQADVLEAALRGIGLADPVVVTGAPRLRARLQTPRGLVEISS